MNEAANVNLRIAKAAEKARQRARAALGRAGSGRIAYAGGRISGIVFVHYAQRGIG